MKALTPDELRQWALEREREMARWMDELTLLSGELITFLDSNYDHSELEQQVLYLHSRLWEMRHTFGFAIERTPKTAAPDPAESEVPK